MSVRLLLCLVILGASVPRSVAQVKIGQVAGAPGALTAASAVAFQATGNIGYLSNPGSGLVQKFRVTSGEILASVGLPAGVGPITLSFDERTLLVLGVTAQKIYMIRTSDMTIARELSVAGSGFTSRNNILMTQDNEKLFIADAARNGVEVFNGRDGSYDRLIPVGINPTVLTLMPNGKQFGVLSSGRRAGDQERVDVIDMQTPAVIETQVLDVDTEPFNNIQFSLDNRYLVVAAFNNNALRIKTLSSTGVLASRPSGGTGPTRLLASPNGRYLAVINATSRVVSLKNLPEAFPLRDLALPDTEFTVDSTVAFSTDSRTLYVPSYTTGEVVAFDVESGAVLSRTPVGGKPVALALTRDGHILTSLNVGSNDLALVALTPIPLYIPHLTQNATDFSGLALANFGTEGATIALVARSDQGTVLTAPNNPRTMVLGAGRQIAMTAGQIFGFDPSTAVSGWIEAYTLGTGVAALYLSGTSAQTQLDGFLPGASTARLLSFCRITDGVSAFGSTTQTEILLVNPSEQTANITSRLYDTTLEGVGSLLSHVTRTIPPHGRIRARISTLHSDVVYPRRQAYLEISSDVALQGMEIVRIGDSIAMIPAKVRGLPDTTFFAAQFATGGAGILDTPIYSHLALANVSEGPVSFTMQVTDDSGAILPAGSFPVTKTLQAHEVLQGGADELFGFHDPRTDPVLSTGTLKITADQPGLIGDVVFGDAANGKYLSALSLGQTPSANFGLPHLAEGKFGDPPRGLFTGLALYNPNRAPAELAVAVYGDDGKLIGRTEIRLDGGKRLSQTVRQLVPAVTQQSGGAIRVTSSVPLHLFEVFGSTESEFLAAVPPVPLPAGSTAGPAGP